MTPAELVAHARKQMADLMHVLPMGVYNTMDMLCDLLSSDARPSPGPATETERKDGWWVTPEWRGNLLYAGPAYLGMVGGNGHDGFAYWLHGVKGGDFSTREEAQAALLASVRPKQEGV